LGVKTPTTFVCPLNETTFAKASDILDGPFVVQPPVGSSGENTYFVNNSIERVRNGTTYRDIKSLDEWCILGNLPEIETKIWHEARFAMIQTRESVLDSHLKQLESYAATFVKKLQGRCRILPFNGGSE
ncbi:MAG: hypothetical protein MUO88_00045, partial [Desulfobacterales bacterium]|nr:hypothetical protein [Desulfobacterales bacterium]